VPVQVVSDQQRDEEAVTVAGYFVGRILATVAGVHEPDAEIEQLAGRRPCMRGRRSPIIDVRSKAQN
jgi:hypothetical protein